MRTQSDQRTRPGLAALCLGVVLAPPPAQAAVERAGASADAGPLRVLGNLPEPAYGSQRKSAGSIAAVDSVRRRMYYTYPDPNDFVHVVTYDLRPTLPRPLAEGRLLPTANLPMPRPYLWRLEPAPTIVRVRAERQAARNFVGKVSHIGRSSVPPPDILGQGVLATQVIALTVMEAVVRTRPTSARSDRCGAANGVAVSQLSAPSNDPMLDILSADIATDDKTMTGVIRLADLAADDSQSPTGRGYDFIFTARGAQIHMRGRVSSTGNKWGTTAGAGGTGVMDTVKKKIRISVPLANLKQPITRGTPLTDMAANTYRWVGTTDVPLGRADNATGTKTYLAGAATEVKAGA